jgi:hypothetical protein
MNCCNAAVAVYVDPAIFEGLDGRMYCHLMADSDEELHEMGARLGLRREWCHHRDDKPWRDHYDLPDAWRERALELGAVETDWKGIAELIRRRRREWAAVD